jgi:hypothetical protein
MTRCNLGTTAPPVDLVQRLRDGQLQLLRGIPGTSDLFGALLPPHDLQTEAVEAQRARRLGQLLIPETISRFLRPAPRAPRLDAPCGARRRRSMVTRLRRPFV